jgi:hypothetical protein
MPYEFKKGMHYRMPTHFGPSLGPRQGPDGRKFTNCGSFKVKSVSVSFLTNREQLEELLPNDFTVGAEPVVTVQVSYITELEWLAGRGYNTVGVRWPALFIGKEDRVNGNFLSVLWENLADPIITGREELGFSKLYCEIPEPAVLLGEIHCVATWLGFKFMDMSVRDTKQIDKKEAQAIVDNSGGDGLLHYKYIPKTGHFDQADVAYATLTPADIPNRVVKEMWLGRGTVEFHQATWEDLPTFYQVVNAIGTLEKKEDRGAMIVKTIGYKDLSDQRILR